MKEENVVIPFGDWILEDWVIFSNKYGASLAVTLQIGGMLVSGITTSGAEFLENFGGALSEAVTTSDDKLKLLGEKIKNAYEEKAKEVYPRTPKELNSSKEEQPTSDPVFIHLKSVNIWTDLQYPMQVKYWRGKVGNVDGWFLGLMTKRS